MSSADLQTLEVKNLRELRQRASLYLARRAKDTRGFEVFHILKFNSEGEFETRYTIRRDDSGKSSTCDCPAYIDNCRHKTILSYMIRFGGLNNPNKIIVTDGKSMAWLKSPTPLLPESILELFDEE